MQYGKTARKINENVQNLRQKSKKYNKAASTGMTRKQLSILTQRKITVINNVYSREIERDRKWIAID